MNPLPWWCRAHGRMLRLVKMETVTPAAFTVLGWEVAAIGEMVRGLAGRGVVFLRYPWFEQDGAGHLERAGRGEGGVVQGSGWERPEPLSGRLIVYSRGRIAKGASGVPRRKAGPGVKPLASANS